MATGRDQTTLRGVTLKQAGIILGGDVPISIRTISRLIKRGELAAYGAGSSRRVTMRSIDAYIERESKACHASDLVVGGRQALDIRPRPRTGRGRRTFPDPLEDTTLDVVSVPGRLPKIGLIRS